MAKRVAVDDAQGQEPKAKKAAWTPRKMADVMDLVVNDDSVKKSSFLPTHQMQPIHTFMKA